MSLIDRIRVLVLHDDPIAQEGLAAAFRRYPHFVLQDGSDAPGSVGSHVGRSAHWSVDVVVANYQHGVAIAAEEKRQGGLGAAPRVVVVAGIDREWEILNALECGVRGYILSGCALDELADGVRAVHRGARYVSPKVAARLAENMAAEALTAREEEVLSLVVAGLCNKSIAKKLGIAVGTVKSHLKATFHKLNVVSRTQAIAAVERRGLFRQYAPADFAAIPDNARVADRLSSIHLVAGEALSRATRVALRSSAV